MFSGLNDDIATSLLTGSQGGYLSNFSHLQQEGYNRNISIYIMNECELFDNLCTTKKCFNDPFVFEAIKKSMTTGELDLSGFSISEKLCEIIEYILLKSRNITKVKLCDCMISVAGFNFIINALMHHPFITEVNLYGNNIQSEITKKLGNMLATNSKIKVLILNWNNIGQSLEAFSVFCDGLSRNESLEYLDLRNNQLCSACGPYLSSALLANHHLKTLDLRWNKLQSEGIESIQNALLENKTLVDIQLKGNFAQSKVISHVEQQAKLNEEIEAMKVEYESKIAFLLKEMKKLEESRFRQVTKITDMAHRKIIDMENKVEEVMEKLFYKEELLKKEEDERKKIEKEVVMEREQKLDTMEELERTKKLNLDLKEVLRVKEAELATVFEKTEKTIEREREVSLGLKKEVQDKEKTIVDLSEQIKCLDLKWENQLKEETDKLEHLWKSKLKEVQAKLSTELEMAHIEEIKFQRSLLEEKDKDIESLQKRIERSDFQKKILEEEMSTWQAKANQLMEEVGNLRRSLNETSDDINVLMKELKNEKIKNKKIKEEGRKDTEEITKLNETIVMLKRDLTSENKKVHEISEKLIEANNRLSQVREEEKMRSELLTSALKRYLSMCNETSTI